MTIHGYHSFEQYSSEETDGSVLIQDNLCRLARIAVIGGIDVPSALAGTDIAGTFPRYAGYSQPA
jgi:hypothetical protein